MAALSTAQLVDRIYDVLAAKFDTHKLSIASDVEPIRQLDAIDANAAKGSPAVLVVAESGDITDEAQETGSTRIENYRVEALYEVPYVTRIHVRKVHQFLSALVLTLQREQELLDPTTGEKLPWLFKVWPVSWEITWGAMPRGKAASISIRVQATIDEGESY